jgi:hypothetical protein
MDADLVGFQEVFHEDALREVCTRSGRFDDALVVAPGADGTSGPRLGLATRLPLVDDAVAAITEFPKGLDTTADATEAPRRVRRLDVPRVAVPFPPGPGSPTLLSC